MATIINKNNHLEQEYQQRRKTVTIFLIICIGSFVAFAATMELFILPLSIICMLGFLGGGIGCAIVGPKMAILKSGVAGEQNAANVIASLPNTYYGFQNLSVTYNGETSEVDMVVVGPSGVFIIETKNMNGRIIGNCADRHWTQHKIGHKGTPYSKSFYSPVKQVGTHTFRLAHALQERGANAYVESMVYFANPKTVVQVSDVGRIPVFSALSNGSAAMLYHIQNGQRPLTAEAVNRIAQILNNL